MAPRPSLRELIQRPMPVTAPLVLNPLMARMAEAAGFPAGYLGGGSTGYQKVALEMCQAAVDIGASLRSRSSWTAPAATAIPCTCTAPSA